MKGCERVSSHTDVICCSKSPPGLLQSTSSRLQIALIQVVRSAADICWCTMFSPIVSGAALFILRAVRGRAKSKFNKKQTRAGTTVGDKRGCACTRGCGQLNAAGDQRWSCVCAPRACLSLCVSQSVSWAAAASPWLFSLQMSCAGM